MARGRDRASSDGTRFNWQKPGWPDVTVDRATVERAVAALVADGLIEHRGSKKAGGYFPVKKGKDK